MSPRRSRVRYYLTRPAPAMVAAVVAVLFLNGFTGTLFFAHARPDPFEKVDAIVVLGGEHDGREAYGLQLAEDGYARTVLLSDPYRASDPVMKKACRPRADIEVICRPPVPRTTRGEALMTRALAVQRGWTKVMIVSWRYHLPRARLIFEKCYGSPARSVIARGVPRRYPLSVADWQYVYLYQYAAWIKAEVQGSCR